MADETLKVLKEIRDGVQALDERLTGRLDNLTARVDNLTARVDNLTARVDAHHEAIVRIGTEQLRQGALLEHVVTRLDRIVENTGAHYRRLEDRVRRLEEHAGISPEA